MEYYVYKHSRNGTPFYIGKGKKNRAFDKNGRNNFWIQFVNNEEYDIEIIKNNLTEDEAFQLEKETIEEIGLENLTNIEGGGKSEYYKNYNKPKYDKDRKKRIDEMEAIVKNFLEKNNYEVISDGTRVIYDENYNIVGYTYPREKFDISNEDGQLELLNWVRDFNGKRPLKKLPKDNEV
jgi:hypothetical protein